MMLIEKKLRKKTFTFYKRKHRGKLNSFPFWLYRHDSLSRALRSEVFIFLEAKLTLADVPKFL